jgi:hypothetical protein
VLRAALAGERRELTDAALMKAGLSAPLEAMKTTAAIHWEALRLWAKGVAYLDRDRVRASAPETPSPSHPAKTLGDRKNVLVAATAEIHHHQMVPRPLRRELDHFGQRMRRLERRNDAFEP